MCVPEGKGTLFIEKRLGQQNPERGVMPEILGHPLTRVAVYLTD